MKKLQHDNARWSTRKHVIAMILGGLFCVVVADWLDWVDLWPQDNVVISGQVADVVGEPLARVTIITQPPSESTRTNRNGRYTLDVSGKEGDRYTILAELTGYVSDQEEVTLASENNTVNFTLIPRPPATASGSSIDP